MVLGGAYAGVEKTMIELDRATIVQETRSASQDATHVARRLNDHLDVRAQDATNARTRSAGHIVERASDACSHAAGLGDACGEEAQIVAPGAVGEVGDARAQDGDRIGR